MPFRYQYLLLILCSASLFAQPVQPYFQSYTTEDGLGGEAINDILVDRYGYVWTAAYSGLHRYDGYDFVEYRADPLDSCALSNRTVSCLLEDARGNIWAGSRTGLNRLDRKTGCFQRYFHDPLNPDGLPGNEITHLALDEAGDVFVQTTGGTAAYDFGTDAFTSLPAAETPWQRLVLFNQQLLAASSAGLADPANAQHTLVPFTAPAPASVFVLRRDGDTLLLGTSTGLYFWDGRDTVLRKRYPDRRKISEDPVLDLLPTSFHGSKGYWIATRGDGLVFLDAESGDGYVYEAGIARSHSLLDNHVRALADDDLGALWIGSYVGLNRFRPSGGRPTYYRNDGNDGLGEQIMEIHADHKGNVFLYERWRGLFVGRHAGRSMRKLDFPQNDFLQAKDLDFITTDRAGTTWFLRGKDGLYRYDEASGQLLPEVRDTSLSARRLNGMAQDPFDDDVYWLATEQGLGRLDMADRKLRWWMPAEHHPQLTGNVLASLLAAPDGKIWLSAGNYYNDHLGYFDPTTETFHFYTYQPGDPERIAGGRIKQIAQDKEGTIWCAASQGLITVDAAGERARLITRVGGQPVGALEAVLTDTTGGVWFTRDDQIGYFQPATDALEIITCSPIRQFTNSAATVHPDGRLLFGGMGGVAGVKPYSGSESERKFPRLVLNEVLVNGEAYVSSNTVQELSRLDLTRRQRSFTLRFSGLLYDRVRHVTYAYRLDDGPWIDLGTQRSLSFAGLPPGTFRLALRASDGQGNWNPDEREIMVSVAPFWHETNLARILLFLFIGGLVFSGIRLFLRRRLERQSITQMQELAGFKSRFLTNLTHELRTPLTLIIGPAKRLARRNTEPTVAREGRRIYRQGNRLLALINQLLDLRKLEEGALLISSRSVVLGPFLAGLTETFRAAAEEKPIRLFFSHHKEQGAAAGAVEVDISKVETIVTNLIANGLKFTPVGGEVRVSLAESTGEWTLEVGDSGPGIPTEDRERVFGRFTRLDGETATGTGIGLSLARELAHLLGGDISVGESPLGGASFTLRLPRLPAKNLTEGVVAPPVKTPQQEIATEPKKGTTTATVLIVEDDPDLRAYLAESLAEEYDVLAEADGNNGLETAFREIPDLVVSDVMMPGLSGLQLCARLKNDRRTSHLPVLLLTARTADEHRMEGLSQGADAYLTKPFAERELRLRLRNLLTLRDAAARELSARLLAVTDNSPVPGPSLAPTFIDEVRNLINERLDDPNLSVEDLEKGLGLSRSQLHRKLKATLGLSAGKLINQLRLETAAGRLRAGDDPISGIAYDCGFRDGSYFGKRFREKYGVTPGEFRREGSGD